MQAGVVMNNNKKPYILPLAIEELEDGNEKLKAQGMVFVEADKAAFKQQAQDAVLAALTDEQKDLYLRIIETK